MYLNGYYSGIVDDFDGIFQRLRAAPGEHDLTLYRDGYRTVTQHIYLTPDSTFKVKYTMERLAAGEAAQPRPIQPNPPRARQYQVPPGPPAPPLRGPRNLPPPAPPAGTEGSPGPPPSGQSATGTLEIHVQPAAADVWIDGQPWRQPEGQSRIVIDTFEGRHTVQVRKAGYVGYLTEVQVRRTETTMLDVSLRTQP